MEVTGQLKRINGDFSEEINLSGDMVTFGRGMNNNVVWDSLQISRQHCTFEHLNGSWHLKNTSTNGILIASNPIPKNTLIKLNDLDIIDFIPTEAVKYRYFVKHPSSDSLNNSRASPEPMIINDDEDSNEGSESLLSIGSDQNDDGGCIIEKEVTKRKQQEVIESEKLKKVKQEIDFDDDELLDLDEDDVQIVPPKKKRTPFEEDGSQSLLKDMQEELDQIKKEEADAQLPDDNDEISKLKKEIQKLTTANKVLAIEKKFANSQLNMKEQDHLIEINGIKEELEQSKGEWRGKILSILENEFNCTICSELFVEATVLNCGHTFCYFCIHQWIIKKPECPVCRAQVTYHPRHTVVDNIITSIYSLLPEDVNSKRNEVIKERKEYVQSVKEEEKRKAAAATVRQQQQQQQRRAHAGYIIPGGFPLEDIFGELEPFFRLNDFADFAAVAPPPRSTRVAIRGRAPSTRGRAAAPAREPQPPRMQMEPIDLASPGPAASTRSRGAPSRMARRGRNINNQPQATAPAPANQNPAQPSFIQATLHNLRNEYANLANMLAQDNAGAGAAPQNRQRGIDGHEVLID